jgi:polyisoprenyl-phosphate glycosyltransferase
MEIPKLTILIPVYCEEKGLPRLFDTLEKLFISLPDFIWNVVLVNDGSKDQSLMVLQEQAKRDVRFNVIDLSRNFGKEIALSAGMSFVDGDAVIIIDADLQHPVSYIPQMIAAWKQGAEIVEMVRSESEKEPILRRLGSSLFYYLLDLISETEIFSKTTDFRLLDKKVVKAFLTIEERHRMFRGLIDWLGFRKIRLPFKADARMHGQSVYSYAKLTNLALNSFIGHSSIPLKLVGLIGGLITIGSVALLTFMVTCQLSDPTWLNLSSLSFVVVINTILIGIVLLALGLMSLYISKIYSETQNRPLYIVRDVLNSRGQK